MQAVGDLVEQLTADLQLADHGHDVGVGGPVASRHYDVIIADDLADIQ